MKVLTADEMTPTLFPHFVCALVFEAYYQDMLIEFPAMTRAQFWQLIEERLGQNTGAN